MTRDLELRRIGVDLGSQRAVHFVQTILGELEAGQVICPDGREVCGSSATLSVKFKFCTEAVGDHPWGAALRLIREEFHRCPLVRGLGEGGRWMVGPRQADA